MTSEFIEHTNNCYFLAYEEHEKFNEYERRMENKKNYQL
jgi:hypothetical protein